MEIIFDDQPNIKPIIEIVFDDKNVVENKLGIVYGIIYKITNISNGKAYVGKTKSHRGNRVYGVHNRFKSHLDSAHRGSNRLSQAI